MKTKEQAYVTLDLKNVWECKIPLYNGFQVVKNEYGDLELHDKNGTYLSTDRDLVGVIQVGEKVVKCNALWLTNFDLDIEDSELILGLPAIPFEDVANCPLLSSMTDSLIGRSPERRGER